MKIQNMSSLRELCLAADGEMIEVVVLLNGGHFSRKMVQYLLESGTWCVYNYIDDTEEFLRTDEMKDHIISKAMEKNALRLLD